MARRGASFERKEEAGETRADDEDGGRASCAISARSDHRTRVNVACAWSSPEVSTPESVSASLAWSEKLSGV